MFQKYIKYLLITTCYLPLISCSNEDKVEPGTTTLLQLEFQCEEPLPTFTLSATSNPSDKQLNNLCKCVWDSMGSWEKETSKLIRDGKENEASKLNLKAFPGRFGKSMDECGAGKL